MAIDTRYFGVTAAGGGTGLDWANRAALFVAGNWSTVITGYDFGAGNSLKCLIGPGSYACSQSLAIGAFTVAAPTVANMLFLSGCDSSGNLLAPPDPDWHSGMAAFDDSTLPVIATTTNIPTIVLANCVGYLLKFTASGRNSMVLQGGHFDWVVVVNSTANSAAMGVSGATLLTNSVVSMTGSSYDVAVATAVAPFSNLKLIGVAGSSGNRDGFRSNGVTIPTLYERITVSGFGGDGISSASVNTAHTMGFRRCASVNNGGAGFLFPSTASQTVVNYVIDCIATGNTGNGIDAQSEAHVVVHKCRLRDNASNFNGLDNYPTDFNNYTTDSDDATEYVSAAGGDFRIKNTAATWGQGFGPGDEPAAGGGTTIAGTPMRRGMV